MPPALFVFAHPDDEVLAAGVAVAEHLAFGRDVHVLWLTDGGTTGARNALNGGAPAPWWGVVHQPAAEGYAPLSVADCAAARIREATNAVRLLGTGYPGPLTLHRAQLQDGAYTQVEAEGAIAAVADHIAAGAPVHVKVHTWLVDDHPDHIAAGRAAKALNAADPVRYPAVRYYVLPPYWSDARLSQVAETFDNPTDAGIAQRVRTACRAYGAWSPPHTYAVGYHSVPTYFAAIDTNPKCMVHP
jgi:LmbE family N-acetylglucosaminyl deacetylase